MVDTLSDVKGLIKEKTAEVFKQNEGLLRANEHDSAYVINRLKLLFSDVKNYALDLVSERGLQTPSIYFLVVTFNNNGEEGYVSSLTATIRARIENDNIKTKRSLTFDKSFYEMFQFTVDTFFSDLVDNLIARYKVQRINSALLAGVSVYEHLDKPLETPLEDLERAYTDYEGLASELRDRGVLIPAYTLSDAPIADIDDKDIIFGTTIYATVHESAKSLNAIVKFIDHLIELKHKLEDKPEVDPEEKKEQEEQEKAEQEVNNKISDVFYGLEALRVDEEEEDKPEEDEVQLGGEEFKFYQEFGTVQEDIIKLYDMLVSSTTTVELLSRYPRILIDAVVTQPSGVRTRRIAPLFKMSFFTNRDEFADVDDGILFEYTKGVRVKTASGIKLEPENAFHASLTKKIAGEEYSIGLDDFMLHKMAEIAPLEIKASTK